MAVIQLPFGKEKMSITIPDERFNGTLVSKAHQYKAERPQTEIVREALEHPINSPRLRELVQGKKISCLSPAIIRGRYRVRSLCRQCLMRLRQEILKLH